MSNDVSGGAKLTDQQRLTLFEVAEKTAKVGHWRWNKREDTLWWSDQVFRIHGYAPGAFMPSVTQALDAYLPEDRERISRALDAALYEGKDFELECRIRRADGSIADVLSIGYRETDDAGTVVGAFGIIQDISQRRQNERRIASNEMRLRMAAECAGFGVFDWDTAADMLHWDEKLKRIYGVASHRADLGLNAWKERLHPEDAAAAIGALYDAIEGKAALSTEFRIVRPDGDVRYIKADGVLLPQDGAEAQRMVGINYDVTPWRKAQNEAQAARQRAEAADRSKTKFLANMSHEFRTPLNAVIGFGQLIAGVETPQPDEAKSRQYAQSIVDSAQHLLGLIDDILHYSQLEVGDAAAAPQYIAACDMVAECMRWFREPAANKNLTVEVDVPRELTLNADFDQIQSVLRHVLSNAIKFSPEGGTISITAAPVDDWFVCLSVEDMGPGIRAEDIDRVLSPFEKGPGELFSPETGGSGLGLTLANGLLSLNGGRLGLACGAECGTRVDLHIPGTAEAQNCATMTR